MVKHVVDSRTCIHLFVNQAQDWAWTPTRGVSWSGASLNSYRTEIARFVILRDGSRILLINDHSYSVTTSKHQSWLHGAASHIPTLGIKMDFGFVVGFIVGQFGLTLDLAKWAIARFAEIDNLRGFEKRARSEWRKSDYMRQIAKLESLIAFVWHEATGEKPADIKDAADE